MILWALVFASAMACGDTDVKSLRKKDMKMLLRDRVTGEYELVG